MAVVAGAVALGTLVAPAEAACAAVQRAGRWTTIAVPEGAQARDVAVAFTSRGATKTLFLFRNWDIVRSDDGGCTWRTATSLDQAAGGNALMSVPESYRSQQLKFVSLSVSPPGRNGLHTVYAVATFPATALTDAGPAVLASSTDGGRTWTYREFQASDAGSEYPRCASGGEWTTIQAAGDQSTAYLYCRILGLVLHPGQCSDALYVTRDAGRTWETAVTRMSNPTMVSPTNLYGCEELEGPVADRRDRLVVWDLLSLKLRRSSDGGRTWTPFAEVPTMGDRVLGYPQFVPAVRGRVPEALAYNSVSLVRVVAGAVRPLPPVPLPMDQQHLVLKAGYVAATEDVIMFYVDKRGTPRTFRYVARLRKWLPQAAPPTVRTAQGKATVPWNDSAGNDVRLVSDPLSRDVYLGIDKSQPDSGSWILRYST